MSKSYHYDWLALTIGNSRWHWGWFRGESLAQTWDGEHFALPERGKNDNLLADLSDRIPSSLPLYFASVVPQQTEFLRKTFPFPNAGVGEISELTLTQIPLTGIYPTMGIDRALALWGAAQTYGFPVLVIDAGTALTLTGAALTPRSSPVPTLIGGAILPGLKMQLQSLHQKTAALPEIQLPQTLPSRWALETSAAIASGIVYGILAGLRDFIEDWWQQFPQSHVVLTGGNATLLWQLFQQQHLAWAERVQLDAHLIFWGMRSLVLQDSRFWG